MPAHSRSLRCRTPLFVGLLALLLTAAAVPAAARAATSDLTALVPALASASPSARLAFVQIAVDELENAYHEMLATPRGGPRWTAATRAFLQQLVAAAAAAADGAPIQIVSDADATVRVIVHGSPMRQFMITAPRATGSGALEHAIMRRYCAAHVGLADICAGPAQSIVSRTGAASAAMPLPMTAIGSGPAAPPPSRANHAPAGADGLRCAGALHPHGHLLASACQALLGDLRLLAGGLAAAARRGLTIDPAALRPPRRQGQVHQVTVNRRGEFLELALPALARAPEIWAAAQPWLRARLAGKVTTLALTPPARLIYSAR